MTIERTLEADYVVVGGGLTGCALASSLKAGNPSLDIIVCESGPDASDNPKTTNVPGAFETFMTPLAYHDPTLPLPSSDERKLTLISGHALGGGSLLNFGGWVRGDKSRYDAWGATVGDESWNFDGWLPYMRKTENHFSFTDSPNILGDKGPLHIAAISDSSVGRKYGLREPMKAAWEELGLSFEKVSKDPGILARFTEHAENWKSGVRQPSHFVYPLTGIQVLTDTHVTKVNFSPQKRATSVTTADGRTIKARKEIILSAGGVRSAQILQLSGVGPEDVLNKAGVPVVAASPEVGRNFHAHHCYFPMFKLRDPNGGYALGSASWADKPELLYGLPMDWDVNEPLPNDILEAAIKNDQAAGKITDPSLLTAAGKPMTELMVIYFPFGGAPDGATIGTSVMLLVPTSRGTVTISSASAADPPVIDPHFYETAADRASLIHGVRRTLQALLGTKAGKEYIERHEPSPGLPALTPDSSDDAIDAQIKAAGSPHAHVAGTASMGRVVDTKLRVKGVQGLRVADASVFPVAVHGHPQATLYALAQRAAEAILADA